MSLDHRILVECAIEYFEGLDDPSIVGKGMYHHYADGPDEPNTGPCCGVGHIVEYCVPEDSTGYIFREVEDAVRLPSPHKAFTRTNDNASEGKERVDAILAHLRLRLETLS